MRVTSLVIGMTMLAGAASAQTSTAEHKPTTVNQRLENQHDRIQAGVKDDQVTKGEATHLRAEDAAIHAEEKVYRQANDGKLTKGERRQLNRQLNRTSAQIYRDRHNARRPK